MKNKIFQNRQWTSLREQVIESLIIEELQLQLANRAGVRISDAELNDAITRIAANNEMSLQQFIDYIVKDGESYEDFRENVKKQMIIKEFREEELEMKLI